jgi:2-polyprenyl-3-methyl-5-hydroxy-6-metoxy-1,4-benzoquinol methylase
MRPKLTPAGRDVLALYRDEPLATRLHTAVRWRSCPFEAVADALPRAGRILDLGCGHGLLSLLLAKRSPAARPCGTDVDAPKIGAAQRAAFGDHLDAGFAVARGDGIPTGPWDGIAIVDVLYLIDRDGQEALLRAAAAQLAPGGVLVVKEMATDPRWKFRWMKAQETLSVKVLRITEGDALTFVPPADVAGWLTDAGLTVESRRLDRGYIHPHHLLVARAASG